MQGSDALAAGRQALDLGQIDAAAVWYRAALCLAPDSAEALAALAEQAGIAGDAAAAAVRFARAARLEPDCLAWARAAALAWTEAGRDDRAEPWLTAILQRRPDDIEALRVLAALHQRAGRTDAALAGYREVLFLDRDDTTAALAFAELAIAAGDPLAAVELLQPRLARRSLPVAAWLLAAQGWAALGEGGRAADALRRFDADGGDPALAAELMPLLADADAGLPPAYVRALFDRYAERFDENLVGRLHYQVPELLAGALAPLLAGRVDLRVLDLGCGTGLGGEAVAPWAAALYGVDLSPRMIDRARRRGRYHGLLVGDLAEALDATAPTRPAGWPATWDLVIAADVLVYLGDLTPVFAAVAAALVPGGRFAATVERPAGDDGQGLGDGGQVGPAAGWELRASRRYAHGSGHLRRAAAAAGLALETLSAIVPRQDRGQPVQGWLIIARRPQA